jgi:hypothetical protein
MFSDAPLRDEAKVLHGIGQVELSSLESGLPESTIEQRPGRSYKGQPGPIFLIARLFADEHDARRCRP